MSKNLMLHALSLPKIYLEFSSDAFFQSFELMIEMLKSQVRKTRKTGKIEK